MTWDEKFMGLAKEMARWSKDRSRQTACIIVGPGHEIRSTGYNGFPRYIFDSQDQVASTHPWFTPEFEQRCKKKMADVEARHQRPAKYKWVEHAERNACYAAARIGVSLLGCTAYIPWYPCADCARALIQVGISTLVCYEPDWNDPVWKDDFAIVAEMLGESPITVRMLPDPNPQKPKGDVSNVQVRQEQS